MSPRYVVREDTAHGEGWWAVFDTLSASWPAIHNGRTIYAGTNHAQVQREADDLNKESA